MTKPLIANEIRSVCASLERYKTQLFARHKDEPLKSPPVFLLNISISRLKSIAEEAHKLAKGKIRLLGEEGK